MDAQTLIQDAMRKVGVLDAAETASTSELADGLRMLNDLVDNWSSERLNIPCVNLLSIALSNGQAAYNVSPRPLKVETANCAYTAASGTVHHSPVELIDVQKWSGLPFKSDGAPLPELAYYDKGFPTSTVNLYPTPQFTQARTLELYVWQPLASFADLTTDVSFPPAYRRALVFNLALELAGEFGSVPSASVTEIAAEAKAGLRMLNISLAGQEPDSGPINGIPQ